MSYFPSTNVTSTTNPFGTPSIPAPVWGAPQSGWGTSTIPTSSVSKQSKNTQEISTEGKSQYSSGLRICNFCQKYYHTEMINVVYTTEYICQHCYFYMGFDCIEKWNLNSYIEKCKKDHNINLCEKNKFGTYCILCEAIKGNKGEGENKGDEKNNGNEKNNKKILDLNFFDFDIVI